MSDSTTKVAAKLRRNDMEQSVQTIQAMIDAEAARHSAIVVQSKANERAEHERHENRMLELHGLSGHLQRVLHDNKAHKQRPGRRKRHKGLTDPQWEQMRDNVALHEDTKTHSEIAAMMGQDGKRVSECYRRFPDFFAALAARKAEPEPEPAPEPTWAERFAATQAAPEPHPDDDDSMFAFDYGGL